MKANRRVPSWMVCIIIVAALPVTAFPVLLSASSAETGENKVFLWLYPAYVVAAAILAYQCYGRRTEMSWILIVLMVLTHLAMWMLTSVL